MYMLVHVALRQIQFEKEQVAISLNQAKINL